MSQHSQPAPPVSPIFAFARDLTRSHMDARRKEMANNLRTPTVTAGDPCSVEPMIVPETDEAQLLMDAEALNRAVLDEDLYRYEDWTADFQAGHGGEIA